MAQAKTHRGHSWINTDRFRKGKFIFFMMPWFHYIRIFFNILTVTKVEGMGIEETQSVTTAGPSSSTTNVKRDNSTVQKNVTANSTYYKWDMIYDKIGKDTFYITDFINLSKKNNNY